MGIIHLENIKVHTNHGCLDAEAAIGSDYVVNLRVKADLDKAATTDHLADTVDYVLLNRIVKEEMAVRSKLLEHVARRILTRIFEEAPAVQKARVCVAKVNPPIGGDVENVSVVLKATSKKRSEK